MRRSSRSIGTQISEDWAKRKYEKAFLSKLTDADGEQLETQHWVRVAGDCGDLTASETLSIISSLDEVGRMLNGMMEKVGLFLIDANDRDPQKHDSPEHD